MDIVFMAHSHWRNLVYLGLVVVLIKYAIGWFTKANFTKLDRILGAAFTGIVDIQLLFGIILFTLFTIENGFERLRIIHACTNLVAVGILHMMAKWKNAPDTIRFRNSFIVTLVFTILIVAGIIHLSGGAARLFGKM